MLIKMRLSTLGPDPTTGCRTDIFGNAVLEGLRPYAESPFSTARFPKAGIIIG